MLFDPPRSVRQVSIANKSSNYDFCVDEISSLCNLNGAQIYFYGPNDVYLDKYSQTINLGQFYKTFINIVLEENTPIFYTVNPNPPYYRQTCETYYTDSFCLNVPPTSSTFNIVYFSTYDPYLLSYSIHYDGSVFYWESSDIETGNVNFKNYKMFPNSVGFDYGYACNQPTLQLIPTYLYVDNDNILRGTTDVRESVKFVFKNKKIYIAGTTKVIASPSYSKNPVKIREETSTDITIPVYKNTLS